MENKYITISLIVVACVSLFLLSFIISQITLMPDFTDKNVQIVVSYAKDQKLKLKVKEEYSDQVKKGYIVRQSILKDTILDKNKQLIITTSLGVDMIKRYNKYQVDELGLIPIMMYHGISQSPAVYVGGNIDIDGYHRTVAAFKTDLEFYYQSGYRMIKLSDYVAGKIDVPLGKSPIILTFDDGLVNNILVTGLDSKGGIIIDPNSAVGILESFKKKYPDFNITATFFLNKWLFRQPKYNTQILKWLIEHNYDIGNHSLGHTNLDKLSNEEVSKQIGGMYQLLDTMIPGQYINIVALPFGAPNKKEHPNFNTIINGTYNGTPYQTTSTLRVGWESNYSPFSSSYDANFIKRIRAYDNNGLAFDIKMNFDILSRNRYISDGDINSIVIPKKNIRYISPANTLEVITY